MLNNQSNFESRVLKKNSKNKNIIKNHYHIAAKYLSKKLIDQYNLKNPKSQTSNHLIKIFLYFLKYNVQNIQLIKSYSKNKGESLEFKVNIFSNSSNEAQVTYRKDTEVISVNSFFNNNIKLIII